MAAVGARFVPEQNVATVGAWPFPGARIAAVGVWPVPWVLYGRRGDMAVPLGPVWLPWGVADILDPV